MAGAASLGADRFTTLASDLVWTPRVQGGPARPPVVFLGGLNGNPEDVLADQNSRLASPLVEAGFTVVVSDTDAFWGNEVGAARVMSAISYARLNLGCSYDPVVLIGGSMGGGSALLWAAQNPSLVSCVVAFIPAIDYQALRVNNPLFNVRGSLDTAWGVTYPAALPTGSDPATRPNDLKYTKVQTWTASDDPISINHATFEATVGAETHDLGALGHSTAAVMAVDPAVVKTFVLKNS